MLRGQQRCSLLRRRVRVLLAVGSRTQSPGRWPRAKMSQVKNAEKLAGSQQMRNGTTPNHPPRFPSKGIPKRFIRNTLRQSPLSQEKRSFALPNWWFGFLDKDLSRSLVLVEGTTLQDHQTTNPNNQLQGHFPVLVEQETHGHSHRQPGFLHRFN